MPAKRPIKSKFPKVKCDCGKIFQSTPHKGMIYCSRECYRKYHSSPNKGKKLGKNIKQSETKKRLYREGKLVIWNKGSKNPLQSLLNKRPEFQKKCRIAEKIIPNRPENLLIKLIQHHELPFKYTGDGSFFIKQFNPDFINCNGKKQVIEIYGDYWHNLPESKERDIRRENVYSEFGFKTLVIWEHELKNPIRVLDKIMRFEECHHL